MSNVLRISEAATLALHATVLLAASDQEPASTGEIAETLHASEAHLSKVLQRLTHAGLAKSVRGPKGGFVLAKPADAVSLLDVYEAIEGPLVETTCLLDPPICGGKCILGGLLATVNKEVREHLSGTMLSQVIPFQLKENTHA